MSSKNELQNIIKIAESFFKLTGIKVNAEKSDLLIINHELVNLSISKEVDFNGAPITFQPKQKPIRYLGIFLEPKGSKKYQKQLMNKKVNITYHALRSAKISDKQLQYIINSVLVPQLLYLTIDFILPSNLISLISTKIHKLFKSKWNLKQQLPSVYLHDYCWYNIIDLDLIIKWQSIKQFYNVINDNSILGLSTLFRMQELQNSIWTDSTIWSVHPSQSLIASNNSNLKHIRQILIFPMNSIFKFSLLISHFPLFNHKVTQPT